MSKPAITAVKAKYSVQELEAKLRAGETEAVAEAVSQLSKNQIQRSDLASYANIANRVELAKIAYRFLHNVVRNPKVATPATDIEKIEYAESLRSLGLISEAKRTLKEIDRIKMPIAGLRIAFCSMTQWQYDEAIVYLKEYLQSLDASSYQSLVARVNLAAALVAERIDDEAQALLQSIYTETKAQGHHLLHGVSLELLAQLYVVQGHYELATSLIAEAKGLSNSHARYSLYLQKWHAIAVSLQKNQVQPELEECRALALQENEWETVRACDLYIAMIKADKKLLEHVYFGTPFKSYRQRILDLAGKKLLSAESFIWNPNPNEPVQHVLDLEEGAGLEKGHLLHRFLLLLTQDFYRPLSMATAFSELFPEENFSQAGSTNRICQIVKRLRAWLEQQGNPLSIFEKNGSYTLQARPGVAVRVHLKKITSSAKALHWSELEKQLPAQEFTKQDLVEVLGCSPATAVRLLRWALQEGHCKAVGISRQRKYLKAA